MATAEADTGQYVEPMEVPPTVKQRIGRGRADMLKDAAKRRLCKRFERGDTYWYINGKNVLNFQNTASNPDGSGKPGHRIRNTYNVIRPIIQGKVSTATQRTPSYQVVPSTDDMSRVSAAELAQKASRYGYDKWKVGAARRDACEKAMGHGGEGFYLPYFDPNVGPYVPVHDEQTGELRYVGQGEVKVLVLSGNEVYWEPGCAFDESPFWVVERAVPISELQDTPGFIRTPALTADAATSDVPQDTPNDQMVMKTEYFERPCPKYPQGRYLVIANGRLIAPPEPYPLVGTDGKTIDEPILHRLAWDLGDGSTRDFGLTWQLIDSQRTVQDCFNKIIEWKNRALLPQMLAKVNSIKNRRTDEPGAVNWWDGIDKPEWERVPEIPQSLFQVIDTVMQMMRLMASDDQAESQASYSNVAAKTLQQVLEQSMSRWDAFRAHLAETDSRVMRHCLLLCARHYTEPRVLKIKGRDGWEHYGDFQGADLMSETDVRVFPDSLVPQTRQGVQDQLTWVNANFPGWLQPQDALGAIQEGSMDRLMESYWLDKGRANSVVQAIRNGTAMEIPSRSAVNPLTGQPELDPSNGQSMPVPGYMPDDSDNLDVWEKVFADWMKTEDFGRQPDEAQAQARQVWDAIKALKQSKAIQDAQMQQQMAAGLGMANAAAPQEKGMPSLPGSGQPPAPN
jgi:hypothetical protein